MNNKIDWNNLSFDYIETNCSFVSYYKDGKWDDGALVKGNTITISHASTCLHYGQQCFEGLKAYRTKSGDIQLFRPDMNAKRLNQSATRLLMPEFPEDKFIEAVKKVVKANEEFVPPYESGATLYIRPFMIGIGNNIGVKPANEYLFSIFVVPVGNYFKGGVKPVNFITTDFDRAAPHGTGNVKVGGNYAASMLPHEKAAELGFADCIYLDPVTHTKIEEVGAANFFGITKDDTFVTPTSNSILGSVTKLSLLEIAEKYLNLKIEQRDCYIDKLDEFKEAGACGTAAVISPIGAIYHKDKKTVFYSETEVAPTVKKLYDTLVGIQFGDIKPPSEDWIVKL